MNRTQGEALCRHKQAAARAQRASRRRPILMAFPVALGLWLGVPDSSAQRHPHIGYAYPAGGQQGSSVEVRVGGQYLASVMGVHVSGQGVEGVVLEYDRPISQKRLNEMREKLKRVRAEVNKARKAGELTSPAEAMRMFVELAAEAGMTREELVKAAEARRQRQDPKRQLNPQIAESVKVQLTIDPTARVGVRELRLLTKAGFSNPLRFCVGELPEVLETRADPGYTWEHLAMRGRWTGPKADAQPDLIRRPLPVVVNGQILPGEVDRFRFRARKGQQLVAAVSARTLIPYLADAVPGWFQATVALYDSNGKEIAYADDFQFDPDPRLRCVIPKDGRYTVEIRDSIYRGREDFVYRIALGELPYLTGLFPLGGMAGEPTRVQLLGWNLPDTQRTVCPPPQNVEPIEVTAAKDGWMSNPLPFAVGVDPEQMEQEPNNRPANAQKIAMPVTVNGRINETGDRDVFRLDARAGDVVVAEVVARRLGSPLDSILTLTDARGTQVAFNDDHEDRAAGLVTHHADSRIQATVPEDGLYYVQLGDIQGKGGAAYAYRLRVTPLRPDFELRVVPSTVALRAGASVPLTVHVLRRGGFTNAIQLALSSAPAGLSLQKARLTAHTNAFLVRLKASRDVPRRAYTLAFEGRATVAGQEIIRPAVPADDLMQAFIYHHLVPAQEMKVVVMGRANMRPTAAKDKGPRIQ